MKKIKQGVIEDLAGTYLSGSTFHKVLASSPVSKTHKPRVLIVNPISLQVIETVLSDLDCPNTFVCGKNHENTIPFKQPLESYNLKVLTDNLPNLDNVTKLEVSFDLIVVYEFGTLSTNIQTPRSIRKLSNLLKPNGSLLFCSKDSKELLNVQREALHKGLNHTADTFISDKDINLYCFLFNLPDDGSGAFPFIRNVALNDGKAATHKLALLRILLRIADGHSGAVLRREGDRVFLPVGLVALYWCHQYKILIDEHKIFQTPNLQPNMGFMKSTGWHKLIHRSSSDYKVGNLFVGEDAVSLYRTISHVVQNIKDMPCKYITYPNSNSSVFSVVNRKVKPEDLFFIDLQTLEKWGEFSLPESIWLAFSRYACWVEPVLLSEWFNTMLRYKGNAHLIESGKKFIMQNALEWLDPKRTTIDVRKRFQTLNKNNDLKCVWSNKALKGSYDIDHCMPFSRWPNNDLWNLFPTDCKVNNQKRDYLPSESRLLNSKSRIKDWWQEAWLEEGTEGQLNNKRRFFTEANIALPGLQIDNESVDDLFEAILLQQSRLKEMQQLREW